ncbi:MAG: hypothetical protein SFV15_18325 [Polyangiaceae bacterium]|nr:hypothetical protein [Polyangiaceae bacterium]
MRAPLWLPLVFGMLGCGANLPDPRVAARNFALALEEGDTKAAAAMLSEKAHTNWGKPGIEARLKDQAPELKRKAQALLGPEETLLASTQAEVPLANGRNARLLLDGEVFRVDFSTGIPTRAKDPRQALEAFGEALRLMPIDLMLLTLSPRLRQSVEVDRQGLLRSLEALDIANIDVSGERATALLDGGYVVTLVAEDGLWFVEDFR